MFRGVFKKAEGIRAEGRRNQLGGDCDPSQLEAPNIVAFGRGFRPLLLSVVGRGHLYIPSASCLLPSAFPGESLIFSQFV